MNIKSILATCLSYSMMASSAFAFDFLEESSVELMEEETLSYSALMSNASSDVTNLANEAVVTCYNAFKSNYDWEAAKAKEKYGGNRSSATQIAIIQIAKTFANQIIAQIDSLAKQLTPQQRQQFWSATEGKMKTLLQGFCSGHGCSSTGDLHQHIANQINLKKKFG